MERTGWIDVTGGRVWYWEVGGDKSKTPLLLLHGGPGFSHLTMSGLKVLGDERPVIFYDQLGAGKSDRPSDQSLWHVDRFVDELAQVRRALNLDAVHLLGHSWGTMLAAEYLLQKRPSGVKSVIFSSPCLSAPQWSRDQEKYRKQLPADMQATLERCEADGTTDSPEYQAVMKEYYKRHLCRLDPTPDIVNESNRVANLDVYLTMWGPAEFYATGNLKDFDVTDRLHELNLPTLFTCGRYDEATPETVADYCRRVPGAEMVVFENSAHSPYLEEPEEYLRVIRSFLHTAD